ncbi:NUDIX hydrolase [Paracoccus lutimaris]|uniref:ADP-ribose pyrophosphatase YjhB (NUDIX family) n=1 Tax=Paracoccus lutimaris TaxID=1490030 RepID=A0A368YGR9_9RHOB|nr:NUDIX hydrolase [Paracoccus lutimaris]RCW79433.1 ADP-ribose pyrophosphatase YjhB (NUDIX family) [Paracoccus lutimaris]
MITRFRNRLARLIGRRPLEMQVAALCLNEKSGEVLLVTSRGTGRWIVPKGWPMPGRSLADAAAQEAWEEAGVRGRVSQAEIGRYQYDKEQDRGFAIPVEVRVFPLYVEATQKAFPESEQRKRHWFTPAEAASKVAETGLQQILRSLPAAKGA